MCDFIGFHSIFTDIVSEEEWNRTKDQIKKRFNDELFDIDKNLVLICFIMEKILD